MSRLARVLFTPEVLLRLTRGEFEVVENPVPTSATWRYCGYDIERGAVTLVVEDESFAEVASGEVIPILEPPAIRVLGACVCASCAEKRDNEAARTTGGGGSREGGANEP